MTTPDIHGQPFAGDQQPGTMWAPPISSADEARQIIGTVWIPAVEGYGFPVFHRDRTQAEKGKENRRACLLALGEVAMERGSIKPAVDLRDLAARAGLSRSAVAKHLRAEAEAKIFIKVLQPGRSNAAGGFATQYLLLVDRLRGYSRDDRRDYSRVATTQTPQAFVPNKQEQELPPSGASDEHTALPDVAIASPPKAGDTFTHTGEPEPVRSSPMHACVVCGIESDGRCPASKLLCVKHWAEWRDGNLDLLQAPHLQ